MIDIDPASPVPLYLQIVEQVRRLIAVGALRPGDRLPTVRELATTVRVNRNTAGRAIRELEAHGLVRTRVGQGTFIDESPRPVDRETVERTVDHAIDRLLVEAHTAGLPLEELGWRLSRRVEAFRRRRAEGATIRSERKGDDE